MGTLKLSDGDHSDNLRAKLLEMWKNEELTNVTLAIDGQSLKAHQVILSACSGYFKSLLVTNSCKHPTIYMKDVKYHIMKALLQFMYEGQVEIHKNDFHLFVDTAKGLQIQGLFNDNHGVRSSEPPALTPIRPHASTNIPKESHEEVEMQLSGNETEIATKVWKSEPNLADITRELFAEEGDVHEEVVNVTIEAESVENHDGKHDIESADSIMSIELPFFGTPTKKKLDQTRYLIDGYVFIRSSIKGNHIYLKCVQYKTQLCKARAVIPCGRTIDDVKLSNEHNHQLDPWVEEKMMFQRKLKSVVLAHETMTPKEAYATVSPDYPNASKRITYAFVHGKMTRWRREQLRKRAQFKSNIKLCET